MDTYMHTFINKWIKKQEAITHLLSHNPSYLCIHLAFHNVSWHELRDPNLCNSPNLIYVQPELCFFATSLGEGVYPVLVHTEVLRASSPRAIVNKGWGPQK